MLNALHVKKIRKVCNFMLVYIPQATLHSSLIALSWFAENEVFFVSTTVYIQIDCIINQLLVMRDVGGMKLCLF
ncbi:hypothetical protein Hanom_Chr12g01123781 [Helianthus anomalus]